MIKTIIPFLTAVAEVDDIKTHFVTVDHYYYDDTNEDNKECAGLENEACNEKTEDGVYQCKWLTDVEFIDSKDNNLCKKVPIHNCQTCDKHSTDHAKVQVFGCWLPEETDQTDFTKNYDESIKKKITHHHPHAVYEYTQTKTDGAKLLWAWWPCAESNITAVTGTTGGGEPETSEPETKPEGETKLWRNDNRCGSSYPLPSGDAAQCNPNHTKGWTCCSRAGWCGNTALHCQDNSEPETTQPPEGEEGEPETSEPETTSNSNCKRGCERCTSCNSLFCVQPCMKKLMKTLFKRVPDWTNSNQHARRKCRRACDKFAYEKCKDEASADADPLHPEQCSIKFSIKINKCMGDNQIPNSKSYCADVEEKCGVAADRLWSEEVKPCERYMEIASSEENKCILIVGLHCSAKQGSDKSANYEFNSNDNKKLEVAEWVTKKMSRFLLTGNAHCQVNFHTADAKKTLVVTREDADDPKSHDFCNGSYKGEALHAPYNDKITEISVGPKIDQGAN